MATAAQNQQPPAVSAPYHFPPGLKRNLFWFAFRRFRVTNPIHLFQSLANEFGDIAHYKIAWNHIVFLNNPDYIREILVVQNNNFIKERTVQRAKMILGEGMIAAEGGEHRRQRQAAQPAFHRQRLQEYADVMVEEAIRTRDQWQAGETRDIAADMMHLSLRIVGRTLFSTDLTHEARALADAVNRIMGLYNFLVMLPAAEVLVHFRPPGLNAFVRARNEVDVIVHRMIDAHIRLHAGALKNSPAHDRDNSSLLDMLLAAEPSAAQGDKAALQSLRDQVITIFLAGYETVANALSWTWYLLSENPDQAQRMHKEIDEALAGRVPTLEDLPNLRYVEMVIAESMRLYPPAWAMGRIALNDFRLGEYVLPAKTTVLMSQYVIHRDPRYFPDPLRFDPERFTPEEKSKRPKFTYIPFGAGPRQCIGESFAWMEAILCLTILAQKWNLKLVEGHPVEPQPLITLRPKYGMKMTIKSRN